MLLIFTDADPSNYMSYYKRATVFLALSRSRPALADLDKVIQLKNDFMAVSLSFTMLYRIKVQDVLFFQNKQPSDVLLFDTYC